MTDTATPLFSSGTLLASGRYRIERVLGEGGMGTVYAATELALERLVALKVLLPELSAHPTARKRMEAEAKALARLNSPHVVRVHTVFDERGLLVMDLEYVDGGALADRLDGTGVDEATACDWIAQVLSGLEALHEAGLVHRDLKPANVLSDRRGTLKVTDLGIAHDAQRSGNLKTRHDASLGTPEYMAPEQVQSSATVDARADVYAAGVMLYQLLSGRVPFGGEDWQVKAAHVQQAPDLGPVQAKSPRLAAVVARALAKDPAERWPSAKAFREALHGPVQAEAPLPSQPAQPRSKTPLVVGAAAAVALLAAAAWFVTQSGKDPGPQAPATAASPAPAVAAAAKPEAPAFPTLASADDARVKGDDIRARTDYETACQAGSARACAEKAYLEFEGRGGERHREAAHALAKQHIAAVQQACEGGELESCVAAALLLDDGIGALANPQLAVELKRKACDGGNMRGCHNLGVSHQNGTGVAKDEARAVELYRKACDGGAMVGCSGLGWMYANGTGVAKDEARAVELYRKACEAGDTDGCFSLGRAYHKGTSVAKDEARAAELYHKACDGGNMETCFALGLFYELGVDIAKDDARAGELYRKACDGGVMAGCMSLGTLYQSGAGVVKDEARATELYRKACDGGLEGACALLTKREFKH